MLSSEPVEWAAIAGDPAWEALERELALWAQGGRPADLWWRDDDAAEATPALERLLGLQAAHGVPLALAVIPYHSNPNLIVRLAGCAEVDVLQHGWRHTNHAAPGAGGWELGDHRPLAAVAAELAAGQERLRQAFGERFLPVLVPPWNHVSARVVAAAPGLGFRGLSTFGARAERTPAPGLVQVNAHCDPIRWKGGARFVGTAKALGSLIGHLAARRSGAADPDEPTGLVTHHLQMDEAVWRFVERLLQETRAHQAAVWLGALEVFGA